MIGKTNGQVSEPPKPLLSIYTTLYTYADQREKPSSYTAGHISFSVPKDFSLEGKRVEIWAKDTPMYHNAEMTQTMCNAYSFSQKINVGSSYYMVSDVYPNGGNSRGYIDFKINAPISYIYPAEVQIFSPYPERCMQYKIPFEYKSWRYEGFYDVSVFLRLDFYES